MPQLLPIRHLGGLLQLVAVGLHARAGGVGDILAEHLHRVHPDLGREVLQRAARQVGGLLVIGRPPRAVRPGVHRDGRVVQTLVRNGVDDIGQGRRAAAGETAGGPGFRLPRGDGAVLLARDLDLGVGRRTVAGDHLLGGAVEEQFHRTAAGLLRKEGAHLAPGIRRELAAESAANVVLLDVDIGDRHLEVRPQRAGVVRDILRGGPHVDLVALPLDDLPMRLQAAVGDHWNAVLPLGNRFGLLESLVRIAHQFLAGCFGARSGLAQVVFLHQVRQHFILHLDFAHGVAGRSLRWWPPPPQSPSPPTGSRSRRGKPRARLSRRRSSPPRWCRCW